MRQVRRRGMGFAHPNVLQEENPHAPPGAPPWGRHPMSKLWTNPARVVAPKSPSPVPRLLQIDVHDPHQ